MAQVLMTADPFHAKLARALTRRGNLLLFASVLLCSSQCAAQSGPRPPCGVEPGPPYPELDHPPIVKFWSESDLGHDWKPPACTGWAETGFTTLITTAARFRYTAGTEGLLRRIGAISQLAGMRYWSTTHKQWRTLILNAHALTDARPSHRRQDFSSDELRDGRLSYFEQDDNLAGTAVYTMRVAEASENRLVFAVQNVSIMSRFYVTLFRPGEVQTIYFLDRESDNVWRYYSLIRTGRNSSWLASGHQPSSINRAIAFYRLLVGIPTDQEPPAAP